MSTPSNLMRDQVLATPPALDAAFPDIERAARLILPTPDIYRLRRIVLTGSGDSLFAAKAAETALIGSAGLGVEVRPPMEAGCYHAAASTRRDLENTLVIALSHSGGAARVVEATGLYRAAGARVLALTGNETGRLAGAADTVWTLPVPALPPAPGFGPYLFAVTALLLLGIRIGEVRMRRTMDEAQAARAALGEAIKALDALVADLDAPCRTAAKAVAGASLFEFVGTGPGFAVAEYGAAKFLEATGRHALARDLEEWTHLNYFDAAPENIATVIVAPAGGAAEDRAKELFAYMRKLGRRLVVLGGGALAERAAAEGHVALPAGPGLPEPWSALHLSAAPALLAAHLAAIDGAEYGRGGKGAWSDSADASTVRDSRIREPGE